MVVSSIQSITIQASKRATVTERPVLPSTTMLANSAIKKSCRLVPTARQRLLHTTCSLRSESPTKFTNILAGANALTTQVKAVEREGLHLEDGRIVKGPCIFLEGKVFLWNVPPAWEGWKEEHFDIFKVVVPKPGMSYSSFSIVDWMYT